MNIISNPSVIDLTKDSNNVPLLGVSDMMGTLLVKAVIPQNEHKVFVTKLLQFPDGNKAIDCRPWVRFGGGEFGASKSGVMINSEVFVRDQFRVFEEIYKILKK